MALEEIFKFNPNHDERGRFSTGAKTPTSTTTIMGSPNRSLQTLRSALRQMHGTEMRHYIQSATAHDKQFGLRGTYEKGIGLWEGSLEASVQEHLLGAVAPDVLRAAAAAQGKEHEQNAMATWVDDPDGPHTLTTIHLPKSIDVTPQYLADNGVQAATISPGPNGGTKVSIISTEPKQDEMVALAKKLGSKEIEVQNGHADFIDKADYDSILTDYQRGHSQKYDGRKGDRSTYFAMENPPAKRLGAFSFR